MYNLYSLARIFLLSSGNVMRTTVSFFAVQSSMPIVGFSSGELLGTIVIVDIHLQLSQVLVRKFSRLKLNNDMAPQESIVEDEVGEELCVFKQNAFLAGNERKAFAHFEQKVCKVRYYGRFQVFLVIAAFLTQTEEFKHHGVFYYLGWVFGYALFASNS